MAAARLMRAGAGFFFAAGFFGPVVLVPVVGIAPAYHRVANAGLGLVDDV